MLPRLSLKVYCDGLCGKFCYLPYETVVQALTEGLDMDNYGYTCEKCKAWFNWAMQPKQLKE